MIKVLLTGGLGNQLFQYAFGRTLALKNNTNLVLSTSYLQSKLPIKSIATPMRYELAIFNLKAELETNFFSGKLFYPVAKAEHLIREKINSLKLNVVTENTFLFQSNLLSTPDNSFIKGNFQSEKYFKSIEPVLRKELIFNLPLSDINSEWKNRIEVCNAVSIHIRRGDYIAIKKNTQKFAQIPIDYYADAIRYVASKIDNPVFYIFSDDMNWVKEQLKSDFPLHFVENNYTPQASHFDMQLMSLCKYNIICNSTFSWWAAWLNTNPNKIVITPKNWFSDVSINSQDIIPDEWIKL